MGVTLNDAGPQATVDVAQVVQYGEQLIIPLGMTLDGAIDLIQRRKKYLSEDVALNAEFDCFPPDGAYNFQQVLIRRFGWSMQEAVQTLFGSRPPQMQVVEIGPNQTVQVPWGRFTIPGIRGYVDTGGTMRNGLYCFQLTATIKRDGEQFMKDLFEEVREEIRKNSIYKNKAIKMRFRDDDGDVNAWPDIHFIDTEGLDRGSLVYSADVNAAIETNLFAPIERHADLKANGLPIKRGVLLGGTYGCGKTLAARVAAKIAVDNGLTYLYAPRANELADAINFARLYNDPGCVIFVEDIDRELDGSRSVKMDDILNIIDGIDTKLANIIVVLTTNNLDGIHPAMLRPGRLDSVIHVTPPDAQAVEKLLRLYGGAAISPNADLHEVGGILQGCIPAVIAEVVKRAKLSQLRLQPRGTTVTELSAEALVDAASSMQMQLRLLNPQVVEERPTIDTLVEAGVTRVLEAERLGKVRREVNELHERVVG